jgi:molecular chaperone GrpE (heat shock protein)
VLIKLSDDEVIQATQKGFMMNGQVIRHAQVIVAK